MNRPTSRRGPLMTLTMLGAALLAASSVGPVAAAPVQDLRQAQLDAALALRPGGVQVSDNAVAWRGGDVVLVVPGPGQTRAPSGLGSNVRTNQLSTPLLKSLVAPARTATTERGTAPARTLDTNGCPGGTFVKDYYCFYTDANFGGRRLQFTGATRFDTAANWGFDNQVTSWVSNDVDCTVTTYNAGDGTGRLWTQPENSKSSNVGTTNNDKLSSWTC